MDVEVKQVSFNRRLNAVLYDRANKTDKGMTSGRNQICSFTDTFIRLKTPVRCWSLFMSHSVADAL